MKKIVSYLLVAMLCMVSVGALASAETDPQPDMVALEAQFREYTKAFYDKWYGVTMVHPISGGKTDDWYHPFLKDYDTADECADACWYGTQYIAWPQRQAQGTYFFPWEIKYGTTCPYNGMWSFGVYIDILMNYSGLVGTWVPTDGRPVG